MANNVVGGLIVNLGLNTSQLNADTGKASAHFKRFEKDAGGSLNRIKTGVTGLTSKVGLMAAGFAAAAVAGIGFMAKQSVDSADKLAKLSTRIGASVEALSEYQYVAERAGVSFDTLAMGWQRMTRRVAEAGDGTGEAVKALDTLGISAIELKKLKPEDQFEALADALNGVEVQADKVALAMKLFDSEGVSLLQTMSGGAAGIREIREESRLFGQTLTEDQAKGAETAKDSLSRLGFVTGALAKNLTFGLLESITDIIDALAIGIPRAVDFASSAFSDIGKDIFNVWSIFNQSEIDGGGNLAEALEKQAELTEQLGKVKGRNHLANKARLQTELDQVELLITKYKRQQEIMNDFENRAQARSLQAVPYEPSKRDPKSIMLGEGESNQIGNSADEKAVKEAEAAAKEEQRLKDAMTRKLDAMTLSLMTEEERLYESYERRRTLADEAFENELMTEEAHKNILFKLENDFEKKRTDLVKKTYTEREKVAAMSAKNQTQYAIGQMLMMTNGIATHSKKAFEINKALSIAQAALKIPEAAMNAYSWGSAIGGPPFGAAMASLAVASQLAQMSAIKATSFGGGGGAPSLAASGGTPSNPVIQTDETNAAGLPTAGSDQRTLKIDITVDGTGQLDRAQAEEIARSLREYIADGGEVIAA